jgi:hypothetical protein
MGFPVQGLKTKVSQFGSYFRLFCWQIWVCRDDQNTEKEKKKLASLFHFILLTPPLPCPMSLFFVFEGMCIDFIESTAVKIEGLGFSRENN